MEIEDITGKPMKALDIFSISIIYMKEIIMTEAKRTIASDIYDGDIDFVLTVPDTWGDTGKLFMQEAAVQVRIQFV